MWLKRLSLHILCLVVLSACDVEPTGTFGVDAGNENPGNDVSVTDPDNPVDSDDPEVRVITHPGAPLSLSDLETLKAYIEEGREPWKSGFDLLAKDGKAQHTYTMAGPYEKVSRSPNENIWPWRVDMVAIWNLSRMWYFTQDDRYAEKAREILLAWPPPRLSSRVASRCLISATMLTCSSAARTSCAVPGRVERGRHRDRQAILQRCPDAGVEPLR